MAAGPTPDQVYRAKRKLCMHVERTVKAAGYGVMRCGAKRVNVFTSAATEVLIGSIWPKLLRASNGEACVMLETDAEELKKFVS